MNRSFPTGRRKYRNIRAAAEGTDPGSEYNGRVYDSKAQARHAAALDVRMRAGEIRAWIPEVSIPLPPPFTKERMRLDFLIIENDGRAHFQDVKGMDATQVWKLKQTAVQNAYGIEIEVIKTGRR